MKRMYLCGAAAVGLIGLGAGLMFFFDPRNGARRRHGARDRAERAYRRTAGMVGRGRVNAVNRTRGLAALAAGHFRCADTPSDDVLLARVKSRIGHAVPEARGVEIKADHGTVAVTGILPYRDAQRLLKSVASVRGVSRLENHLAIETAQ